MAQWWARLREQITEIVGGMSRSRRMAVAGFAALVVVGLLVVIIRVANPPYATLFSRLAPEDAGEIVSVLQDANIPYRLQDSGSTVLVPTDRVYETRLGLAGQGLPRGGVVGFEIFLETSLGATDFDQLVKYNMALQGELTRTIRELAGVLDARVHIVMPERRLFVRDERPATASVFLQLRPGGQLNPQQVRGITNLIARSVEGLLPENITIVDNWGRVLSDLVQPTMADMTDGSAFETRLNIQRAYERELEFRVQTMLEAVYGREQAIVRVNAAMNFDLEEEREDRYEPVVRDAGIVRSSQIFEEDGTTGSPGGIVGVDANVPGFVADAANGGNFSRREEILNFEVNRIERVRVQSPGRIDRLSVGVWLDGELDVAEQRRVESVVAAALGIDPTRGDTIIVEGMPFATVPVLADAVQVAAVPSWIWIAAGLVGLIVIWSVVAARRRRAEMTRTAVDVMISDDELAEPPVATPEDRARQRLRERAADIVHDKPREAAQLVKVWLTEG